LAATPPDLTCFEEPGGSHKTSFRFKRVSRTRLNVLGGYAARDHRAMVIKQRRLVSEFPRLLSGTAIAGLMDTRIRRLSTFRIRGRNANTITSLLERR
jgi:hypothetical protein